MDKQIMVQIDHVSKEYRLGAIGGTTLREEFARLGAKLRKKEDPTLKIGESNKHYGEKFLALDDVSFFLVKGEAVGIIGHNGAGKSTLLKLLSRVTAPTKGQIGLNGRIASMLEVGTGFHPELTGRENIYMNGAILGMTRAEINSKVEDIIDFSECRQFIDTPVKRYSSGMYVKLAFSVAAHLDSEIMIMDEVLAVGDMAFQKKCISRMRDAATEEGRTVLYVSHNMNTIRQLCDRCIVLDKGRVVYDGDVEEAIRIYLNSSSDLRVSYDYAGIKRSLNETRTIQLLGMDILHRTTNILRCGEELSFVFHCKGNAEARNLKIRLEIFYTDMTIAGTTFSDKSISAHAGEKIDVFIRMSTDNLAPGKYRCVALIYEDDINGNQIGIDRVDPAMYFELVEEDPHSLIWLHQWWGHVRFKDMKIDRIDREL